MSHRAFTTDSPQASRELLERVVREVLARLNQPSRATTRGQAPTIKQTTAVNQPTLVNQPAAVDQGSGNPASSGNPAATLADRVVTVSTLEQLSATVRHVEVSRHAVITPAARDEAKRRGMTLQRQAAGSGSQAGNSRLPSPGGERAMTNATATTNATIIDAEAPERAAALIAQLARRGTSLARGPRVVLSDHPARTLHGEIAAGRRAAMVRRFSDVDRFAVELQPECWVLDMVDLNPVAAVNAAHRIMQLGNRSR